MQTILGTLDFYDLLGDDFGDTAKKLRQFVKRTDEAECLDEEHLLPIAIEIFGSAPFDVTTEYVPLRKSSRSKTAAVARRLHFQSYYSFVLTDFFEGLQNGHYPRQCQMCHKYFVMTSARQTKYCNGWADELWHGHKISCRNLAAQPKQKEKAKNDPIIARYTSRCSAIRTEVFRKAITKEFAAAAKALAKAHKQLAASAPVYAANIEENGSSPTGDFTYEIEDEETLAVETATATQNGYKDALSVIEQYGEEPDPADYGVWVPGVPVLVENLLNAMNVSEDGAGALCIQIIILRFSEVLQKPTMLPFFVKPLNAVSALS